MKTKRFAFAPAILACAAVAVAVVLSACVPAQRSTHIDPSKTGYHSGMMSAPAARLRARAAGEARHQAPSGALPTLDEEVWVIVTPEDGAAHAPAPPDDDIPGTGALVGRPVGAASASAGAEQVPLPLEHTSVHTRIDASIASVNVQQRFHNPYDGKIEALYVFPLPHNAAISGFVMTIGDRKIRGILREREEAERLYAEAKRQGYVASLLTQERPNIFTQAVANIEPGRRVDVDITYFHTLTYLDGWYQYVFPMVVGPRFNPPGSTDGIDAVPRGTLASDHPTRVPYLKPHERSGHDIDLTVDLNAGVAIEDIRCTSHRIDVEPEDSTRARITLAADDRIPNKDFVLRWRVAGEAIKANLLTHRDERGGFFTLTLYPPADLRDVRRGPIETVFVLDCSGSMRGRPLAIAKRAVHHALQHLRSEDTFQVIRFSNDASSLGDRPIHASHENVSRARRYVDGLQANGGTMMIRGIRAALDFAHDPERPRFVVFLTDGYIGNEAEILREISGRLGPSRIFSFGIGSSPNRYLMDRMAKMGRGAVAYVGLRDDAHEVMDAFVERVSHPAMTDLAIAWDGAAVDLAAVFPQRLPDLYVGRPVVVSGRFEPDGDGPVRAIVRGEVAGRTVEAALDARPIDAPPQHAALPAVWARMHIADLMDRALREPDRDLPDRVRHVALAYGLMSAYTAFIAVDSSRQTEGDHGTTVPVAVPVPEGVRYDTAVGGGAASGDVSLGTRGGAACAGGACADR